MGDLIDRKQLRETVKSDLYWGSPVGCLEAIDNAPAVDAVPVIRCKDCIHFLQYTKNAGDCNIWENETKICDFCSYAEKK